MGARETEGAINRVGGAVDKAAGGFDALFNSIKGGAGSAIRALDGVARVMGSIALMGGISLIAGGAKAAFTQVDAVQQATVALRAYETDARKVDAVLKDLLAFARSDQGKLFMRQELFHAAQAMKVAGAETENLARYTEILSRSVSSGMGTWSELERVISRVGSTGRLAGEDFEMLQKMGFQLDASLRNTTVTWEQLFDVLDRASVKVEGQSETIQGRMMTLQTAIRGVGLAFLQVDSETSQFIEGGLGDRIMSGLEHAPALLKSVAGAAGDLGSAIVGAIDFVTNMVRAFQMLPGPVQSAAAALLKIVAAFGALRVAGKAMGMIGALTGLGGLTGLIGGAGAAGGARGLSTAIGGLIGRINPLGLAMTGVIALGASWVNSFMEQKAAVEDYQGSVSDLTATLETLRRQGMRDRATQGEGLAGMIDNLDERSGDMMDEWRNNVEMYSDEWARLQDFQEVTLDSQTRLNALLNEALLDPSINVDAWMSWATSLLTGAENAEELKAAVELIVATPLSDFAFESTEAMDALDESLQKVGATAGEVREIFETLPAQIDDLRIDGLTKEADELERMGRLLENLFSPQYSMKYGAGPGGTPMAVLMDELDAAKLEGVGAAWERISDAIASGDFDNARLIAEMMAIINDPSMSLDEKADEITNLSVRLNEFVDVASIAADVMELLGKSSVTSQLDLAGLGGEAVSAAANVNELSASMDTLFRVVVGNTNAIGSQFEALFKWADDLIAAEGVWSKLDDLLAAGRISGEHGVFTGDSEYARAQQAYNQIAADNAAIQEHILTIQAKQAPLLAANASAMEDYMGAIADMPVNEQLAALGFMDSGLQQQLGTVMELAGHYRTMGAEGDAAFKTFAEGIAMTNPGLFAMMESLGVVTNVKRDLATGEVLKFDVDLSGVSSMQDSMNDLIESVDALTVALGGVPPQVQAIRDAFQGLGGIANDIASSLFGPATWGDTGVPVVTGLPNTGTGTVEVVGDDTSAANMIDSYIARDGEILATMRVWAIGDDTSAANMISSYQGRANETLAEMMVWAIADDTSAANMISHYQGLDGSTLASMYVWAIGNADSATNMINAMSAYNGLTLATTYVDLVTRRIGDNIVGRATGGMVSEDMTLVGELGPELVSLPRGSYVHTNADSARMMNSGYGGGTYAPSVSVTVNASTNADPEEIATVTARIVADNLTKAVYDRRTGMGAA